MPTDDKLQRAADELEIRNLIARLAMAADEGTAEDYAALFTEDARWTMAPLAGATQAFPPRESREEIVASLQERRASGGGGPGSHTRHVVAMTEVDIARDTACARSYMTYYRETASAPQLALIAVYHDDFRRTEGGWKLCVRDIRQA